ncbi:MULTISPECIES: hypothetical protein [unclassified Pseudoalteromonas]|uniref:hypothetical protein n=1 Tax=unclassified Pseudoalteromonas TaxID=194690 RepID=UPI001600B8AF|nr:MULTISPECIES: hypothetical protein [unclassified Pseudoalteromonas]MBB1333130.1 hypothetical protein [Pseudoalteromonas sp. SR41-6]MBB1458001.1 hypothetical protein [Pseudoalteromonas sp. SG41-8]
MAKTIKNRLGETRARPIRKEAKPIVKYSPYIIVDCKQEKCFSTVKIWFERNNDTPKQCKQESLLLMKGSTTKFWMIENQTDPHRNLREIAATLFSKWAVSSVSSRKKLNSTYDTLSKFITFCIQHFNISSISEIDEFKIVEFKKQRLANTDASTLRYIFPSNFPRSISIRKITDKKSFDANVENIFESNTYDDSVLMQLLGYATYQFNFIKERWGWLLSVDEHELEERGYLISAQEFENQKKPVESSALYRIIELYKTQKNEALILLHQNFLVFAKSIKFNTPFSKQKLFARDYFFRHIIKKLDRKRINRELKDDFVAYVSALYERGDMEGYIEFKRTYLLTFPSNEAAIILLLICQTGFNRQPITSLLRQYDLLHWKNRTDIELGVDAKKILSQTVLRVTGKKTRGVVAKNIDLRVPVNSFIYEVLDLWESVFSDNNSAYFIGTNNIGLDIAAFCKRFPIYDENIKQLTYIDSRKLRKVYAATSLVQLLDSTSNASDLARKLRDALNHNNFDTTICNYILKTGVGNFVYSSAVLALTNKMFEEALEFKGSIGHTNDKSLESVPVYLCDCKDPLKPTHDIPIAGKCKLYDLCLGCERSVVFAEHIPRICFRILQYENMPSPTNEIIADRKAIAIDCLEKFRNDHPDGELIVDQGFVLARSAESKDQPMLPPIL